MARVNGRMPGNNRLIGCSYGCCGHESKPHNRHRELQEEIELAVEEVEDNPHEVEDDPNWDGAWDYGPDDLQGIKYVKFIPAPKDDSGW